MYLEELTNLKGVSGDEDDVRNYIKDKIEKFVDDLRIDSIGNLIAYKKGKTSKYKVMVSAHMDEVGLIVTGFGDMGAVKFRPVGGIDSRILPGKRVLIGEKGVPGVIGCKPIHMQKPGERTKNIPLDNMFIDIGVEKKEEAEKLVEIADYIVFDSEYLEFGDECVKAKALDDRVGCSIIMDALKEEYEFDLYACFTVQEEVGLRGAQISTYNINPDIALVVEGTTCSDVPEVKSHNYSTELGKGPAITIMDRVTISDKELVQFIFDVAKKQNIQIQTKKTISGGNDAGEIQRTRQGIKVATISVPCRYIHSPSSVMSKRDYMSTLELVKAVLKEIDKQKS